MNMSSTRHQMIYFLVILTRFHFSSSVWQYSHGLKKLCGNKTKHLFCVENLFVLNLSLVIVENPIWVRILNNITQSNALQQFCMKCFLHLKCAWALAVKDMKHRSWSKIFTLQYAHLGLCARHTISLSLKQNSAELYFGEIALEMSIAVKWAPSTFLQHFMRYGNVYNVITHCIYSLHNIFLEN